MFKICKPFFLRIVTSVDVSGSVYSGTFNTTTNTNTLILRCNARLTSGFFTYFEPSTHY